MFPEIMSEAHLEEVWGIKPELIKAYRRIMLLRADLERANARISELENELTKAAVVLESSKLKIRK